MQFPAHKVYGPTGVGILYAKKKWLESLPPYIGGGGMISEVKKDKLLMLLFLKNMKQELCLQQRWLHSMNLLNLCNQLELKI